MANTRDGGGEPPLIERVVSAWYVVTRRVGACEIPLFEGRSKEQDMLRALRAEIARFAPAAKIVGPDVQERFQDWFIDLVVSEGAERIAIEAKYKTQRDSAAPDNRKAAFFDLFKLEKYVRGGEYSAGLFLWLTNNSAFLSQASGDSAAFSTHNGRRYSAGTALRASRARNKMPLPLLLSKDHVFRWRSDRAGWHSLAIRVVDG